MLEFAHVETLIEVEVDTVDIFGIRESIPGAQLKSMLPRFEVELELCLYSRLSLSSFNALRRSAQLIRRCPLVTRLGLSSSLVSTTSYPETPRISLPPYNVSKDLGPGV